MGCTRVLQLRGRVAPADLPLGDPQPLCEWHRRPGYSDEEFKGTTGPGSPILLLNNRKSSRGLAPRMPFYLLPSRPQRPVLLPLLVFRSGTSLMTVPLLPPLYPLLILFLLLHVANGRWGEASKVFPPDQRGSAWSFVRLPIVWDPGEESVPAPPPSFLTGMPGRLLSWGPLTVVDALAHVFRRKCMPEVYLFNYLLNKNVD